MLIHRRAPKHVTSRGTCLGHSGGLPGIAGNPKKTLEILVLEAYFGGVLGGSRGGGVGGSFLAQKWGFPDPPENTGFSGVWGVEKVLI
jgi:hypothetical protein